MIVGSYNVWSPLIQQVLIIVQDKVRSHLVSQDLVMGDGPLLDYYFSKSNVAQNSDRMHQKDAVSQNCNLVEAEDRRQKR